MIILVIDDHPSVAIAVLTVAGHTVRTAVTAADGLALLTSGTWDAVMLDLGLPDVTDIGAWVRSVRDVFVGRIVVSSAVMPDDVHRAAALIAATPLSKPHTSMALRMAVVGDAP